jgi:hypothetical protein
VAGLPTLAQGSHNAASVRSLKTFCGTGLRESSTMPAKAALAADIQKPSPRMTVADTRASPAICAIIWLPCLRVASSGSFMSEPVIASTPIGLPLD